MFAFLFYLLSLGVFHASVDNGAGIDPNGGLRAAVISGDQGCAIDPNGRCSSGFVTTDEGNGLDPHGSR